MALSRSVEEPREVLYDLHVCTYPMLASRVLHRVSSFASEHGVQVSTWKELPREVIEIVMKNISHDDLWTCRKLSNCWAAAAKASGLL